MKRILSSINGGLSSNNGKNNNKSKDKSEKIKEKIRLMQEHDVIRNKKDSDQFLSKLKSVRPATAKKVLLLFKLGNEKIIYK